MTYLLKAMGDADLRVQLRAIDYLGSHRASDATPLLVQKLYLKGSPDGLRQHVLTALGRIGDPSASRPIVDFLSQEDNADVRGTAIYALGEIGDVTVQEDLRKIGDQENDARLKGLVDEALTKIAQTPETAVRTASGRGRRAGAVSAAAAHRASLSSSSAMIILRTSVVPAPISSSLIVR